MKRNLIVGSLLKILFALLLLSIWHGSQHLLEHSKKAMGGVSFDRGHSLLGSMNDFLHHHDNVANAVLIITSAHIDIVLVGMVLWGIIGKTIRPTVAIFFILIFRQLSQLLVSAPMPAGMIWHYPGFPSLIVTYYTMFDFFFSGHTASATLSALEIGQRHYKNKIFVIIATMLVFMEIFCMLSMRFHYTADVITGVFAAVTAFVIAKAISPYLDKSLQSLIERITRHPEGKAQ
jgi:hypothetical protein